MVSLDVTKPQEFLDEYFDGYDSRDKEDPYITEYLEEVPKHIKEMYIEAEYLANEVAELEMAGNLLEAHKLSNKLCEKLIELEQLNNSGQIPKPTSTHKSRKKAWEIPGDFQNE
jgi:hypothetical protein